MGRTVPTQFIHLTKGITRAGTRKKKVNALEGIPRFEGQCLEQWGEVSSLLILEYAPYGSIRQ